MHFFALLGSKAVVVLLPWVGFYTMDPYCLGPALQMVLSLAAV